MIAASGHGLVLAVFPLVAATISLVFAGVLVRRYLNRRRPHEGLWAIALLMYSAASAAMFVGEFRGWTGAAFRTYWVLGAVLNVPYLARFKLPKDIRIVDELPHHVTGRVLRRALREADAGSGPPTGDEQ
jgi:acyl-CoA synthetase (AMP-forming)/AMP-acid ligase II